MSMFDRFRSKPKKLRIEPWLAPNQLTLNDRDLEQLFGGMSARDMAAWFSNVPDQIPFRVLSVCIRRLYDIAAFDHGVSNEDRNIAIKLVSVCKETMHQQFANDPKKLAAFNEATAFTESRIPLTGVNTLAWLLDEHKVASGDTVPFIMMPEHGNRLAGFLQMFDAETLAPMRPHLVRQLIMQRQRADGVYTNSVLHLHGLVCNGDPAASAILTKEEMEALALAPQDYEAARKVLADLALLSPKTNALPISSPPEDSLLQFIVSQSARDTLADEPAGLTEAVQPPEGMEGLETVIPIALCTYLGLTMIEALYGSEKRLLALDGIEVQFRAAADAGLMKLVGTMIKLEKLARAESSKGEAEKFSLDQSMIFAAWQDFELWPEDEETWLSVQPYLQYLLKKIYYVRIEYCTRFRTYLRFFLYQHEFNWMLPDVRNKLAELYVQYGSRAGVVEGASSFNEDWIGFAEQASNDVAVARTEPTLMAKSEGLSPELAGQLLVYQFLDGPNIFGLTPEEIDAEENELSDFIRPNFRFYIRIFLTWLMRGMAGNKYGTEFRNEMTSYAYLTFEKGRGSVDDIDVPIDTLRNTFSALDSALEAFAAASEREPLIINGKEVPVPFHVYAAMMLLTKTAESPFSKDFNSFDGSELPLAAALANLDDKARPYIDAALSRASESRF